jgi:hypothetical protein
MRRKREGTLAQEIAEFISQARKDRKKGRMSAETMHRICNSYIGALRSGSRRRSQRSLRRMLRDLRADAAADMRKAAS